MLNNCCMPQCNSVSTKNVVLSSMVFRKNKSLRKKWLVAIKSGKHSSRHCTICSLHFTEDDYISSLGEWKLLKQDLLYHLYNDLHESLKLNFQRVQKDEEQDREKERNEEKVVHATEQKDYINNDSENDDNAETFVEVKTLFFNSNDIIIFKITDNIIFLFNRQTDKSIFPDFIVTFDTILIFVRDNIDNINTILTVQDQLLITLMKYKHNFYYATLQMFFDIDQRTVTKIIEIWASCIYRKLKTVNFWSTKYKASAAYHIIIDCTEIPVEKSNNPIIQQTTYSTYYGTHTFKVLVGCHENGSIFCI